MGTQAVHLVAPRPRRWLVGLGVAALAAGGGLLFWYAGGLPAALELPLWLGLLLAAALLWRRLHIHLLGPVLAFDLIRTSRRARLFLVRSLYAAAFAAVVGWYSLAWLLVAESSAHSRLQFMGSLTEVFSSLLLGVQFAVGVLLTPLVTAGTITEEKERKTLEFLLATDLRNTEVVLGKLTARLAGLVLLLLTGVPVLFLAVVLGGLAPELVLAGCAMTLATMVSLAALGALCSVYARRTATAVILTYLSAGLYVGISLGGLGLYEALGEREVIQVLAFCGIDAGPLRYRVADWTDVVGAGNPVLLLARVARSWGPGTSLAGLLPGLVAEYAAFHLLATLACAGWAVARVRAVARQQAETTPLLARWWAALRRRAGLRGAVARTESSRVAPHRPRVGERPVLWKEAYVEGFRLPLPRFRWCLALAWFVVPPLASLAVFYGEGILDGRHSWIRRDELTVFLNVWARGAATAVGFLVLLFIALRSAAAVSGERARGTLDALLLTALDGRDLLADKAAGSVLNLRHAALLLVPIWAVGIGTGGLHPLAAPLQGLAWLVYAAFFSVLGLWFSVVCRSTLRALIWTVLALVAIGGAHWLLWAAYVIYFLLFGGMSDRNVEWLVAAHSALTPPGNLFLLGLQELAPTELRHHEVDFYGWKVLGISLFSLLVYVAATVFLWRETSARFQALTCPAPEGSPAGGAPRPSKLRWTLRLALRALVLLSLLLGVAWYLTARIGEQRLQEALAEADASDPGWRLEDLEARRAPVPDEENAALVVRAAAPLVPWDWPPWQPPAPVPGRHSPTLAQVIEELPPECQLTDAQTAKLRAAFAHTRQALELAGRLSGMPRGRFPADRSLRHTRPPPHVADVSKLAGFLALASARRAQEGDADAALALACATLNAARALGDEPSLAAQQVRAGLHTTAARAVERALGQGEPSPEALAAVQLLLEDEESQPLFLTGARGARARIHEVMRALAAGEVGLEEVVRTPPEEAYLLDVLRVLTGKYAHGETLALSNRLMESASQPADSWPRRRDPLHQAWSESSLLAQVVTRPWLFAVQGFAAGRAELRCAAVAVACERHRSAQGRWPDSLDVLVPAYLTRLPQDPYNGQPLRLRQLADGIVVYSVGVDLNDDSGKLSRRSSVWRTDQGTRLWDVGRRRQPPTPPAPGATRRGGP